MILKYMSYIVLFCHSVSMATMEHNNRFWITELETTVDGVLGGNRIWQKLSHVRSLNRTVIS
jgi:hypothetical protein